MSDDLLLDFCYGVLASSLPHAPGLPCYSFETVEAIARRVIDASARLVSVTAERDHIEEQRVATANELHLAWAERDRLKEQLEAVRARP